MPTPTLPTETIEHIIAILLTDLFNDALNGPASALKSYKGCIINLARTHTSLSAVLATLLEEHYSAITPHIRYTRRRFATLQQAHGAARRDTAIHTTEERFFQQRTMQKFAEDVSCCLRHNAFEAVDWENWKARNVWLY